MKWTKLASIKWSRSTLIIIDLFRGCQFKLSSSFFSCTWKIFFKKSHWIIQKNSFTKRTGRGEWFLILLGQFCSNPYFFQSKPKMEPTCKLHAKCLKTDEGLAKCYMPECNNFIHLSCSKMLLKTFGEDEWEGIFLCGKGCFKHHKKSLTSIKSRILKRVPWSSDVQ